MLSWIASLRLAVNDKKNQPPNPAKPLSFAVTMSRKLAEPPPESRYSYQRATAEVEREISDRGVGAQKQVAGYLNLTEQQFSHRMRGAYAKFSVQHFGAIADHFKMPQGWPFVPLAASARKKAKR
jgi:hypothetical protein